MILERVAREMVELAGGKYVGIQKCEAGAEDLILFNDPETESTIAIKINIASVSMIKAKMLRSRLLFTLPEKTGAHSYFYLEIQEIKNLLDNLGAHIGIDRYCLGKLDDIISRLDVVEKYLMK